ncbi:MAG: DNA-processing protein DprA, partial [Candidatus Saccharimonadales bacterium]
SVAHQAALDAGGATIAVLPSSLERIYPASHQHLAEDIAKRGGALVSEYQPGTAPMKHQFIARNRLIAGLSQAVLVSEAAHNSGSLHTANFCLELGKPVLAVPGNINSPGSVGCNRLIQTGAGPVLDINDILEVLHIAGAANAPPIGGNPAEQTILDLLGQGISDGNALLVGSLLAVPKYHQTMTMLELKGYVKALGGNSWQIKYG